MDSTVFLSEIEVLAGKTYEIGAYGLCPLVSTEKESVEKVEDRISVLPSPPPSESDDFPDGGIRAWVVVFGAFCAYFASWGYLNSWALFQAYYQQTTLHRSSPSEIAWIGSLQHSLIFLPGLISGRLFDIGFFRIPYATGSLLIVIANFLIPMCKVYWHYLLCQGFAIGLGCGLTFTPTATIITHWWKRRRGLAFGIAASGGALGGTFFPIVIRKLLVVVGFAWTLRIVGFILMLMLGIANLCVVRRLPSSMPEGGLIGLRVFRRQPAFAVYCAGSFAASLGAFTILTYMSSSAVAVGLSRNFAFYLVAIINGSSGVGRVVCGFIGDRVGPLNVVIPMTILVGTVTVAWPFCRVVASFTIIAIVYGFSIGGFSALDFVVIGAMSGTEDLGRRIGIITTLLGIGTLCGPPLGGLFNNLHLGYQPVGYFGGGMILLACCFFVAARLLAAPKLWKY
ncbi:MFS general substrate transporter [Mycena epipterygia]|nr:MFS general substrate transporter [Mycena epipterygia]